ncbi:MAG TPA: NAD-dependent epimerase/dehydratase family protein [Gaiellaceae bacterium]|nr:NAD-dependent epimerase/dehydratase family protein [Gaiellaceae bacterium]
MEVYVTGASGFVGRHVARALEAAGAEVRSRRVDLLDPAGLERAVRGCDAVVHVAALYSYDADPRRIEAVNVHGTRNLLDAAARAGVSRFLHTSTAGTCGPVAGRAATERDRPPAWELAVPYKRTKLAAERLVLAAARAGLDAVVVNPTTPVGPGDRKPTPTGAMVAGVARGRMRAYLPTTGLNVVDVRDVAAGHALALEHGRRGRRYLLGGRNLRLRDLFALIAEIAGLTPPRLPVPYPVVRAAAAVGLANRQEVALARLPMFFDSTRAEAELGYAPGPVEPALAWAVHEALAADTRRRPLELYLSRAREIRRASSARHEPAIPSRT